MLKEEIARVQVAASFSYIRVIKFIDMYEELERKCTSGSLETRDEHKRFISSVKSKFYQFIIIFISIIYFSVV